MVYWVRKSYRTKKTLDYCYDAAVKSIESLSLKNITHQHINEVIADFISRDQEGYIEYMLSSYLGLFLSALYNSIPDQFILFDVPDKKPLSFVGYKLKEDKVLVLASNTLCGVGEYNEGIIVNNANVYGSLCKNSRGIGVNFGSTTFFARLANKGIYVNFGNTSSIGSRNYFVGDTDLGTLINEGYFSHNGETPANESSDPLDNLRKSFESLRRLKNPIKSGRIERCLKLITPIRELANQQTEIFTEKYDVVLISY